MTGSPLLPWLGQRVTVVVDRPLGSRHPRHPDIAYPVNYGYIPGTMAGDGDPIDAYVVGMEMPIDRIDGDVIAVVVRHNDVEGKLVVAPAGQRCTRDEISDAIQFQERFFDIEIVMDAPLQRTTWTRYPVAFVPALRASMCRPAITMASRRSGRPSTARPLVIHAGWRARSSPPLPHSPAARMRVRWRRCA